jgi:hypothetical protein
LLAGVLGSGDSDEGHMKKSQLQQFEHRLKPKKTKKNPEITKETKKIKFTVIKTKEKN